MGPGAWRRSRRSLRGRPWGKRRAPRRVSCSRHMSEAGVGHDLQVGLFEPGPQVQDPCEETPVFPCLVCSKLLILGSLRHFNLSVEKPV